MECIEEKLIELVRENPAFYDTSNPQYVKSRFKQEIWLKIARKLNLKNADDAKTMWTKLRDNHRDALRRQKRKIRSGVAAAEIKPWKFQSQMKFLLRYMVNEYRESNFTTDSELLEPLPDQQPEPGEIYEGDISDEEENIKSVRTNPTNNVPVHPPAINSATPSPQPPKKKIKNDIDNLTREVIAQLEQRNKERQEERQELEGSKSKDELYLFFMSMYQHTKKMPLAFQHSVKKNIFLAVSEAEACVLNITEPSDYSSQQHYPPHNLHQQTTSNWTTKSSPASTSPIYSAFREPGDSMDSN